jgi:hypothetical protein
MASEVMPKCMPAKNQPRKAATMMAIFPDFDREDAVSFIESLMILQVGF